MRVTKPLSVAVVVMVLVGCSDGHRPSAVTIDSSAPATLPLARPVATSSTSSSVATSTTVGVDVVVPEGATMLSADGPWRLVPSAPGIESPGLVYELMPELWVFLPSQSDFAHGVVWTFHERDRVVIEAWLRAMVVYFRGVTADPMQFEGAEWDSWFPVRDMPIIDVLEERRSKGYHLDLDLGLVLRPEVLGEQRTDTTAIVFDCELDGSILIDHTGAMVPPSRKGVGDDGVGYRMEVIDGSWRVTQIGSQPDACM